MAWCGAHCHSRRASLETTSPNRLLTPIVIPTNVGIQVEAKGYGTTSLDSRLHGNDILPDASVGVSQ